jgi:NAD-specific glutamate dehydrogenase
VDAHQARTSSALTALRDLEHSGPWTFAKTIIAAAEIRVLSGAE